MEIPTRLWIGLMIFSGCLVNYTMRVNLSVNIVAMVPVATNDTQVNDTTSLDWTPFERAHVLSSYFWGYLVASLIAGTTAESYGPRRVIFVTTLASVVLTFLSPLAAKASAKAMIALRVILGLAAGFMFPSSQVLIAHWAVPYEKGKFVGAMIGGTIGSVIAWSLCGVIIESLSWEWGFYLFGITSCLWCLLWWALVYDSPEKHPRISESEKKFICKGLSEVVRNKTIPPYRSIISSIPVWSLFISTFGHGWGIYFVQNAAPMYISNVLGYKLTSTGFLSSISYLLRSISAMIFGYIGDKLLQRKLISLKMLRKSFTICSHIIPGVALLIMAYIKNPTWSVVLIAVAMGANGATTVTSSANCFDLAPNFAGTIYGMSSVFSTTAGIITPLVVASFTEHNETSFEAWQPVFYTGSVVIIVSAIIFIVFGSTKIQNWNNQEEGKHSTKTKC